MTFDEVRAQFPVLERVAYLNTGTFGPLARATIEAMRAEQEQELELGRSGSAYFDRLRGLREEARIAVGRAVGAPPEHVALAYSTSAACNLVLAGLDLAPDDEIVTTDVEHFGLLGPLHASRAAVRVATVRQLPPEGAFDAIAAEIGPRTKLLALSHVSWLTGNLLPVERLQAETGIPLLVDGAQSGGAIALEPHRFDFYTVSGQKWLCGPDATGALVVADPDRLRVALPTYFSIAGYEPDGSFTPKEGAARFDSGSIPLSSFAGLIAATETVPDWRFERARETAERCRTLLAERYEVVTAPGQATLVTFRAGSEGAETVQRLAERGVIVRNLPHLDWLRASCGYWTSDEDLERLLDALAA